jgi:hypothetical protein
MRALSDSYKDKVKAFSVAVPVGWTSEWTLDQKTTA